MVLRNDAQRSSELGNVEVVQKRPRALTWTSSLNWCTVVSGATATSKGFPVRSFTLTLIQSTRGTGRVRETIYCIAGLGGAAVSSDRIVGCSIATTILDTVITFGCAVMMAHQPHQLEKEERAAVKIAVGMAGQGTDWRVCSTHRPSPGPGQACQCCHQRAPAQGVEYTSIS